MIYEDEDDVGYFFLPNDDELVNPPEFRWPGKIEPTKSIDVCNRIMLRGEQQAIVAAAHFEQHGDHAAAERWRQRTDYDGLGYREEVDSPASFEYNA